MHNAATLPSTLDELNASYKSGELFALVREKHPSQAQLSDFELFRHTYVETHGPHMCELTLERLKIEFDQLTSGGPAQLYFVRSLLPNFNPGSA